MDTFLLEFLPMLRKVRIFTPGPTPLLPAAQFAMAAADMHHRTPEFRAVYSRVLAGLKDFYGTANDVIVFTSSGTGAMEASVSNLTSPGEEVVVITAGKFGERWTKLCKVFGCKVTEVRAEYGETPSIDEIKKAITPTTRAVFMQATETSTGVRHNVAAVVKLLRGSDTLLIVDAITGLGTTAFEPEVLTGADVLIGGSQKAFMIPPGLSFAAVSERAWQRMETSKQPRYYFDFRAERKVAKNGEAAFTPSVALVCALDAALQYIAKMGNGNVAAGRDALVQNAERCAQVTREAVAAAGLQIFGGGSPSAAVTAVKTPSGISSTDIVKKVKSEFGGIMSDGQGDMKGNIFRIAHLGFFDYMDTIALLAALEHALVALAPDRFELGTMVPAAQRAFAEASAKPVQVEAMA